MSGIEKMSLLSLAIDRISKHGHYYLREDIASEKMKNAITSLQDAVKEISNWEEFTEHERDWWVDLKDDYAQKVWDECDIEECKKCGKEPSRSVLLDGVKILLCIRCIKQWNFCFQKILDDVYSKNLRKWLIHPEKEEC